MATESTSEHSPVLDPGEIDEIELQFKDADDRALAFVKQMDEDPELKKVAAVTESYRRSVNFVRERHAEIIQHLRNDLKGIKRVRWK